MQSKQRPPNKGHHGRVPAIKSKRANPVATTTARNMVKRSSTTTGIKELDGEKRYRKENCNLASRRHPEVRHCLTSRRAPPDSKAAEKERKPLLILYQPRTDTAVPMSHNNISS
ncbi:hypothetical protein VTN49DRAFT_4909 [Thermomyces lanuginosus]|uniref:uncharacterized protein n=1 Tax=Thermomyces lanuginosus TaxID=5541 RepID=UPI0037440F74